MKTWIQVANSNDVIAGGGACVKLGGVQIALFKLPGENGQSSWYAVQNLCPHDQRQVLSRGLTGDLAGEPKVACPLHKNNFSLQSGEHLAGASPNSAWRLATFPVKELEGRVLIELDTSRLSPPPAGVSREPGEPYDPYVHRLPT